MNYESFVLCNDCTRRIQCIIASMLARAHHFHIHHKTKIIAMLRLWYVGVDALRILRITPTMILLSQLIDRI